MSLSRRKIARVALGVPLEDDLWSVMHHKDGCEECLKDIEALRVLASEAPSMFCIDAATLIEIGHSNKHTQEEGDHLLECMRCARIGQYVSTMSVRVRAGSQLLSLTA